MSKIWIDFEDIRPGIYGNTKVHGGSYPIVPRHGETVEVKGTVYTVETVLYLIEHNEMQVVVRLK